MPLVWQRPAHPMLTAQRKALILARLAAQGQIVAKELAAELGISEGHRPQGSA